MNRSFTNTEFPLQVVIITFFLFIFLSISIGYLPSSDEYLQAQAALNLKGDLGYTITQHLGDIPINCSNDCYPDYVYLSAWPPGYTLLMYFTTFVFSPQASLIIIKIIAIATAYLSWSYFVINYLCEDDYKFKTRMITLSFLALTSFQSTTDVFLVGCVPFVFAIYREIAIDKLKTRTILFFNLAVSIALLMKYQSLFIVFPFYCIALVSFIRRRDLKTCILFFAFALIPLMTTAVYLGLTYVNVGHISTQMVSDLHSSNYAIDKLINLIRNDIFIYLNVIFRESFLINRYFDKIMEVLGVHDDALLIIDVIYFSLFGFILFFALQKLTKTKKGIYIKLIFIILISNTVGLVLLQSLSSSIEGSGFRPWIYYRYHTVTALLFLVAIVGQRIGIFGNLQRFIVVLFSCFTIVFIGVKSIEANRAFVAAEVVNDDLKSIRDYDETKSIIFFSNQQIWRTDWSTDRIHRFLIRDFFDLPEVLPANIVIVVACYRDNKGFLGQIISEDCSNMANYEKRLRSIVEKVQLKEVDEFFVLKGIN